MRTLSAAVSLAALALFAACAAHARDTSPAPCPIRLSVTGAEYRDAGEVKIRFTPAEITNIQVLTPWPDGFTAIDLARERELPRTGVARTATSATREYPVVWGLPLSVWYHVRKPAGSRGHYELPPGRYQLSLTYRDRGVNCSAASEPFTLRERSYWVSTEE